MKKKIVFLIFILTSFNLSAQTYSASQYLYKFSPLAEIIVRNLGMEDKNANGVIDKGANEGYEGFIEKYGTGDTLEKKEKSIDCGFYANYVLYGDYNFRLEENEIVNYYYLNIRFKYPEETEIIDKEIKSYVYANNLPLVWLDDEKGTVMGAVTKVLGEGWNEKQVTEDEAFNMLKRALNGIKIKYRTDDLGNTDYYYTLPEFITKKSGFCYEVAQFGFWFYSELKINSINAWTALTPTTLHEVNQFSSGKIVDYYGSSYRYNVTKENWHKISPIQSISIHYEIKAEIYNNQTFFEQSIIYDKYDISNITHLMYINKINLNYKTVIELGEYILQNSDISKILNSKDKNSEEVKKKIKLLLGYLLSSYSFTNNKIGCESTISLLKKYYSNDNTVKNWIKAYN